MNLNNAEDRLSSWRLQGRHLLLLARNAWALGREKGLVALSRKAWDYLLRYQRTQKTAPIEFDWDDAWSPLRFAVPERIQVSIIIPVFNQSLYTFNCLKSIHKHTGGLAYEIIIVDDGSTDNTAEMMPDMAGVRYLRNDENVGFVGSCNAGAGVAQGEFLVFLNNDTMVTDGWLDAMLDAYKSREKVGLVGAKLVFPDGRLQEAGGMIFQDGSAANIGKWEDPEDPLYNYLRRVDYCSGACLLISKGLFDDLGGFDKRYAPAYYEDTDLAMAVRQAGCLVLYQPLAVVVHFEGQTCGVDMGQGVKRYQEVNKAKFREKWQDQLAVSHAPAQSSDHPMLDRDAVGCILVIDNLIPTPDRDSGSLRIFSLIRMMVAAGWQVIFWPHNLEHRVPYTTDLQQLGVRVYYGRRPFVREIRRIGPMLDAAWVCRPGFADQYMDIIRRHSKAKLIYDTVDLHFVREGRRAMVEGSKGAARAARSWKKIELLLADKADHIVAISPEEREVLAQEGFAEKIVLLPNVHELGSSPPPFEARAGLMFIGSFLHPPNVDAVLWFVAEVLPLIRLTITDIHFTVVGSTPPSKIVDLADEHLTVTGFVPEVKLFFDQARVFVAPLRYGAGLKGKIGQSLAHGLPTVTTTIGAEGFPANDGDVFWVADDAAEFAAHVIELYNDEQMWGEMSNKGRQLIQDNFSPRSIRPVLLSLLEEMASREPC